MRSRKNVYSGGELDQLTQMIVNPSTALWEDLVENLSGKGGIYQGSGCRKGRAGGYSKLNPYLQDLISDSIKLILNLIKRHNTDLEASKKCCQ